LDKSTTARSTGGKDAIYYVVRITGVTLNKEGECFDRRDGSGGSNTA
jgi:hypothetical protein